MTPLAFNLYTLFLRFHVVVQRSCALNTATFCYLCTISTCAAPRPLAGHCQIAKQKVEENSRIRRMYYYYYTAVSRHFLRPTILLGCTFEDYLEHDKCTDTMDLPSNRARLVKQRYLTVSYNLYDISLMSSSISISSSSSLDFSGSNVTNLVAIIESLPPAPGCV
eukprot:1188820-Prorocentrum_minimum.AAC.5